MAHSRVSAESRGAGLRFCFPKRPRSVRKCHASAALASRCCAFRVPPVTILGVLEPDRSTQRGPALHPSLPALSHSIAGSAAVFWLAQAMGALALRSVVFVLGGAGCHEMQ